MGKEFTQDRYVKLAEAYKKKKTIKKITIVSYGQDAVYRLDILCFNLVMILMYIRSISASVCGCYDIDR
jgi:hypothetical protein